MGTLVFNNYQTCTVPLTIQSSWGLFIDFLWDGLATFLLWVYDSSWDHATKLGRGSAWVRSALVYSRSFPPGPNFIELRTKICLAWNFFFDKTRITNQISICFILLVTGIQLLFACPENHMEIWLVILFLSRKIFMLSNFFVLWWRVNKLGPAYFPLYLSLLFLTTHDECFKIAHWYFAKVRQTCPVCCNFSIHHSIFMTEN